MLRTTKINQGKKVIEITKTNLKVAVLCIVSVPKREP